MSPLRMTTNRCSRCLLRLQMDQADCVSRVPEGEDSTIRMRWIPACWLTSRIQSITLQITLPEDLLSWRTSIAFTYAIDIHCSAHSEWHHMERNDYTIINNSSNSRISRDPSNWTEYSPWRQQSQLPVNLRVIQIPLPTPWIQWPPHSSSPHPKEQNTPHQFP